MKKLVLSGVVFMLMSFVNNVLMAQNVDQLKMMEKYIGSWQANRGKDTVEVWNYKPYGSQAFIVDIYQIIKGKIMPVSYNPISYDPRTGKFYGFTLLVSGYYGTWIGSFSSDTKFNGDMLGNFNPQPVYGRLENIFKNPNEWTCALYSTDGIKYLQLDFVKIK